MRLPRASRHLVRLAGRLHAAGIRRAGWLRSRHTLVLVTIGRRSGTPRATPLRFAADGERLYVAPSFAGADEAPGWYRNLLAEPAVRVERGDGGRPYRARTLSREEAVDVWPKLVAIDRGYAAAQMRTTRPIPIVELTPSG